MGMIRIEMFPALHGDCFLISLGLDEKVNILVDSGLKETYHLYLKDRLIELSNQNEIINLLVITHIDEDHIRGAIELFSKNPTIIEINEVWHNSYRHLQFLKQKIEKINYTEMEILRGILVNNAESLSDSASKDISALQGSTLAALLYQGKFRWNTSFKGGAVNSDEIPSVSINSNIKLRILSPSNKKLESLAKRWLKELRKKKYNFNISDEEIFDDAFEFHMRNLAHSTEGNESKPISAAGNISFESLLLDDGGGDVSPTNGSSIAFIIEYADKKLLFLGDAHPELIYEKIAKLVETECYTTNFDLIKVSHHGSKNNTSKQLLSLIDAPIYLISTDGTHGHPDLSTIANIISRKAVYSRKIIFNYPITGLEMFREQSMFDKYHYYLQIPDKGETITIEL